MASRSRGTACAPCTRSPTRSTPVVEGGHENALLDVSTPDCWYSTDTTLETLYRFKAEETLKTSCRSSCAMALGHRGRIGNSKMPQSRAYAERASGDYLWQVDIDVEFYRPEEMRVVFDMLAGDPDITAVSFKARPFWGGYQYVSDGWYWRRGPISVHRLFKWGPGYRYLTHQPPTVVDGRGQNLRMLKWVTGDEMARRGVRLYHYDHVFPHQVHNKALFYRRQAPEVCAEINEWAQAGYFELSRPYHVERHYWLPAWIERYKGPHPPEALHMMEDIRAGKLDVDLRRTDDIERLLHSPRYWLGRTALKVLFYPVDRVWRRIRLQGLRAWHIPRKVVEAVGLREKRARPTHSAGSPDDIARGGTR